MKVTSTLTALVVAILLRGPASLHAAPRAVGFTVSDEIGDAGTTVTATVLISSLVQVEAIAAAKFSLQVDPLLLTPTAVEVAGPLAAVAAQDLAVNLHPDRADVSLLTAEPVPLDLGTFLTITFAVHPLARVDEACSIEMVGVGEQEIVLLENATDAPPGVKAEVDPGSFVVRDGLSCVQGDASVDGQVNTADAILTLRIVAQLLTEPSAAQACGADANIDRKINTGDAVWILREVVGLPNKAPAPPGAVVARWEEGSAGPVLVVEAEGDLFGMDLEFGRSGALSWSPLAAPPTGLWLTATGPSGERRVHWASGRPLGQRVEFAPPVSGGGDGRLWLASLTVFDAGGQAHLVTVEEGGVRMRPATVAAPELRLASFPNPFNPRTTVTFVLPHPASVRLDVVDVRGQLVRRLSRDRLGRGEHQLLWDGTDDAGRRVASGVYVARLTTGDAEATRRLLLLK